MSHPDSLKIEYPRILADVASSSHAMFGNFILSEDEEQIVFLRSMKTVELYRRVFTEAAPPAKEAAGKEEEEAKVKAEEPQTNQTLELVTKYEMCNTRCLDMTKISIKSQQSIFHAKDADYQDFDDIDEKKKDVIVLHLPKLKVSLTKLSIDNCAILVRPTRV